MTIEEDTFAQQIYDAATERIRGFVYEKEREESPPPALWNVIFYNDSTTTWEFVIEVLCDLYEHQFDTAILTTETIHTKGEAVVGQYSRDVAETKAIQTIRIARKHDYPLNVSFEEDV